MLGDLIVAVIVLSVFFAAIVWGHKAWQEVKAAQLNAKISEVERAFVPVAQAKFVVRHWQKGENGRPRFPKEKVGFKSSADARLYQMLKEEATGIPFVVQPRENKRNSH